MKTAMLIVMLLLTACAPAPETLTPQPPTVLPLTAAPPATQPATVAPATVQPATVTPSIPSTGDQAFLPNPALTPGSTNLNVTQANIQQTVCVSGWTATVRPPVSYTDKLKVQQIAQYGYSDTNPADYEEDHLISLELGGNPTDPQNLWPQSRKTTPYNASTKDTLEDTLKKMVCAGQLDLATAQTLIRTDWVAAYEKYVHQTLLPVTAVPTEP